MTLATSNRPCSATSRYSPPLVHTHTWGRAVGDRAGVMHERDWVSQRKVGVSRGSELEDREVIGEDRIWMDKAVHSRRV